MTSSINKRQIGRLGEDAVCHYLVAQGAKILCRNFQIRGGEIDIIAQQDEQLLFVEVKTRRPDALISGAAAITPRKQQFLIRAAQVYLQRHPTDLQPRFDVAEVIYTGHEVTAHTVQHIAYLTHAFDASSNS